MEILEQLYRALHQPLIPFTAFGVNQVCGPSWEVRLDPSINASDLEVRQRQGQAKQIALGVSARHNEVEGMNYDREEICNRH